MIERGLDPEGYQLFFVDDSKALSRARRSGASSARTFPAGAARSASRVISSIVFRKGIANPRAHTEAGIEHERRRKGGEDDPERGSPVGTRCSGRVEIDPGGSRRDPDGDPAGSAAGIAEAPRLYEHHRNQMSGSHSGISARQFLLLHVLGFRQFKTRRNFSFSYLENTRQIIYPMFATKIILFILNKVKIGGNPPTIEVKSSGPTCSVLKLSVSTQVRKFDNR